MIRGVREWLRVGVVAIAVALCAAGRKGYEILGRAVCDGILCHSKVKAEGTRGATDAWVVGYYHTVHRMHDSPKGYVCDERFDLGTGPNSVIRFNCMRFRVYQNGEDHDDNKFECNCDMGQDKDRLIKEKIEEIDANKAPQEKVSGIAQLCTVS
eukprot:TRINITY_DN8407_c0_g1_i1.p1 TRINITY_DN8407_c0_g1~~TRINITY_DN8407_c0_g1_i1.p1  ORF type:complete len:154 (+),score=4.32 TRINITY_DN8407_c0_g1_i1:317-778(+)